MFVMTMIPMLPLPAEGADGADSVAERALTRLAESYSSPVTAMSVHEIRAQLHLVRSARAAVDARELALHRHLTDLSVTPGSAVAVDPEREVVRHAGLRQRDTRLLHRRAATVDAAPVLGDLLASGATTAGHLDAVGQALAAAGDHRDRLLGCLPQIAERAVDTDADSFIRFLNRLVRDVESDEGMSRLRQQRRSTQLRIWNDRDGMLRCSGAFDVERGAIFAGILAQRVEAMFHSGDAEITLDVAPGIDPNDHRRALALLHLCTRGGPTEGDGRDDPGDPLHTRPARAEIVVHVDHHTLVKGLHGSSTCRTSDGHDLPPAVVRRLACEAHIIPVVLSGDGVPLDVGRARRLATVHQRRALEALHTTCAIDGCTRPISRCVVHHLDPWEKGGPTSLDNLVPLCNRHHHNVHDDGWRLRLDPATRRLTVTLPGHPPGSHPPGSDPPG